MLYGVVQGAVDLIYIAFWSMVAVQHATAFAQATCPTLTGVLADNWRDICWLASIPIELIRLLKNRQLRRFIKQRLTKAMLFILFLISGINLEANRPIEGQVYFASSIEGNPRIAVYVACDCVFTSRVATLSHPLHLSGCPHEEQKIVWRP